MGLLLGIAQRVCRSLSLVAVLRIVELELIELLLRPVAAATAAAGLLPPVAADDLVLAGAQQGLDLLARCLVDPGDAIIMDRPGYVGAIQSFNAAGAKLIGWDVASADMDELGFNTAIAHLFTLNNRLKQVVQERGSAPLEVVEPLLLMLAPLAPHVAEELWSRLGHAESLALLDFPVADPDWLTVAETEIAVQLNGKVRARVTVPAGLDEAATDAAVRADTRVAELLDGAAKGMEKAGAVEIALGPPQHRLGAAERQPGKGILVAHPFGEPECVGERLVHARIAPEAAAAGARAERRRMDRDHAVEPAVGIVQPDAFDRRGQTGRTRNHETSPCG